jgi:hypothetical protein
MTCEWQYLGAGSIREFSRDLITQILFSTTHHNLGAGVGEAVDHRTTQPFG